MCSTAASLFVRRFGIDREWAGGPRTLLLDRIGIVSKMTSQLHSASLTLRGLLVLVILSRLSISVGRPSFWDLRAFETPLTGMGARTSSLGKPHLLVVSTPARRLNGKL